MSEWLERTLGDICDEVGGILKTGPFGSQLHQSDYTVSGIPVVMPKNIIDDKVSTEDIAYISTEDAKRLGRHRMQPGDIVYGRRGDIGRQALITNRENGWLCGTGCLRISLGDSIINPLFLHYYLMQPEIINWIYNQAIGATMPNLNTKILRSVPICYPSLKTQHRIASILSAYDDLIENNNRRINALEQAAHDLYREWFVEFRFPGHEDVPLVDSEVGSIPEGWTVVPVGETVDVYRGRSYRSKDLGEGLPFLNLKCVDRDGGFRIDGIKSYSGDFKNHQMAKPGDIIMAVTDMTQERRIIARAARVPDIGFDRFVYSMDLVKIAPKEHVRWEYLYGMFRYGNFADTVKQFANGANVLHLNPSHVSNYLIPLPTQILTAEYSNFADAVYREVDILNRKNRTLRKVRDLLLPRLVSGQMDVSEREIEVGEDQ